MSRRRIVLDTNCLISSLSKKGQYYPVWKGLQTHLLLESSNVELINPYFSLHFIDADHDDNKFVDCAFAANATFIVSNDKHFDVLKEISFPQLIVLKLKEFLGLLQSENK